VKVQAACVTLSPLASHSYISQRVNHLTLFAGRRWNFFNFLFVGGGGGVLGYEEFFLTLSCTRKFFFSLEVFKLDI